MPRIGRRELLRTHVQTLGHANDFVYWKQDGDYRLRALLHKRLYMETRGSAPETAVVQALDGPGLSSLANLSEKGKMGGLMTDT